jgi:hypothetical protein
MPGYLIIPEEACDWSGKQTAKVPLHAQRLGLFDLLREFDQVPFPFDRSAGVCLYGLDDLLERMNVQEDANESRDWAFLQEVRRRLNSAANDVFGMPPVHVPIRRKLVLGADNRLYAHQTTGKRIPLWRIFGANPQIKQVGTHVAYEFGESLS